MTKLISLDSLKELDYKKLGLICGLEIHQQLNTGKLFCPCPCEITPNEELNKEIKRSLRFSSGESGEIDKAALEEFKKGKYNIYKYNDKIACLVDLDEEPPKGPNEGALNVAFGVSKYFNLKFFDKIQFMRKLIVDGSVTTGFQRTAMLGLGGEFKTNEGIIKIDGINLEEDSCRNIERKDNYSIFSLDRQGIPLIEITTGPQIHTPSQALEAATYIGNVLRSFKEIKRGLGTIRQDVNISIEGGARIEIKGAQNLKLIKEIINDEIRRQIILKSIHDEVLNRGVSQDNFTDWETYDVTSCFKNCDSKVIKSNLTKKNDKVLALKLFKFKGILGHELQKNYRFASEVSDRNKKHFPTVKGLFHSDELPKYGIEQIEVDKVRKELKLEKEDSFILIANDFEIAKKSLQNVATIIDELIGGVPTEVRQVDSKSTLTKFLRPMPGSARMYPETDIEEIKVDFKKIDKLKLPELYNEKLSRIKKNWELEENKIIEVLDKFSEEEVSNLLEISNKSASALYGILFDIPKDIKKRDNIEPIDFKYDLLKNLLNQKNDYNQKILRDIFISLYQDKKSQVENLKDYLDKKGLIVEQIDEKEVENKIKEIIDKNKNAPIGALMGICMKEFKGGIDGKTISQILKKLM